MDLTLKTLCVLALATLVALPASAQFGLPTTFAGGIASDGNMFDVVASRDLVITGFDVTVTVPTLIVEVWVITDGTSFVGSETTPSDWTLIEAANVIWDSQGNASHLVLSDGIAMTAGQTLGLYITARTGGGMVYSGGSDFGGVAAADASLAVLEGVGKSYPFGSTFGGFTPGGPSRIWNGRIYYDVVGTPSPGFAGGTTQSGNMFDIVANRPIQIRELDLHLQSGSHTVEIYVTNGGSFVGSEMTPSDWTLIGSATVVSSGLGSPTSIPLLLAERVSGNRGFYVTVTSGFGMVYEVGSDFGGVAVDDGVVQIREGTANAYPFGLVVGGTTPGGPSRIWNGTLRYSLEPVGSVNETFDGVPGAGTATTPAGWLQDLNEASGTGSDWHFRDDSPTSLNGPFSDHTNPGVGNFAHTEDSGSSDHAAVNLLTPPVVIGSFNPSLGFWVNSNDAGSTQNPLTVDVIAQPSGQVHRDIVLQIGETAGTWTQFRACLTPFMGEVVQVRFRGRTDGGSFDNDVGLDDVQVGVLVASPGVGQAPQPGLAVLDINEAGEPEYCRSVLSGAPGPYSAITHPEDALEISISSEPTVPVLFFAGSTNPDLLDLGAIGKLDVGNVGLTNIVLIADGNGTGFLDSLFRTDAMGDLHVSLPTPSALLGFSLGFQVITFNSSPSAISLSNAVDVTFIP